MIRLKRICPLHHPLLEIGDRMAFDAREVRCTCEDGGSHSDTTVELRGFKDGKAAVQLETPHLNCSRRSWEDQHRPRSEAIHTEGVPSTREYHLRNGEGIYMDPGVVLTVTFSNGSGVSLDVRTC